MLVIMTYITHYNMTHLGPYSHPYIHPPTRPLMHPLTLPATHPLTHPRIIHSHTLSLANCNSPNWYPHSLTLADSFSLIHPSIPPFTHWLTHSLTRSSLSSVFHSPTLSLHSPTHTSIRPLDHSLTPSLKPDLKIIRNKLPKFDNWARQSASHLTAYVHNKVEGGTHSGVARYIFLSYVSEWGLSVLHKVADNNTLIVHVCCHKWSQERLWLLAVLFRNDALHIVWFPHLLIRLKNLAFIQLYSLYSLSIRRIILWCVFSVYGLRLRATFSCDFSCSVFQNYEKKGGRSDKNTNRKKKKAVRYILRCYNQVRIWI